MKAAGNQKKPGFKNYSNKEKGISDLLKIVLEQPVGLRAENGLGREKQGQQMHLCLVNPQIKGLHPILSPGGKGHRVSRVERSQGLPMPLLRLFLLLLAVPRNTGSRHCVGGTVRVHFVLACPSKTSFTGNWRGEMRIKVRMSSQGILVLVMAACAGALIPSSSPTQPYPWAYFPSEPQVISGRAFFFFFH